MAGAITQNPVGIGYETVKAAIAAMNGEELPAIIDTGFTTTTSPSTTLKFRPFWHD
jgi:ABC-type sugar transport system substrate-binding protein